VRNRGRVERREGLQEIKGRRVNKIRQPKDCKPFYSAQLLQVTLVTLRCHLAFHSLGRQGGFAVSVSGWAQEERAAVRGGNQRRGRCHKCAH